VRSVVGAGGASYTTWCRAPLPAAPCSTLTLVSAMIGLRMTMEGVVVVVATWVGAGAGAILVGALLVVTVGRVGAGAGRVMVEMRAQKVVGLGARTAEALLVVALTATTMMMEVIMTTITVLAHRRAPLLLSPSLRPPPRLYHCPRRRRRRPRALTTCRLPTAAHGMGSVSIVPMAAVARARRPTAPGEGDHDQGFAPK
jgi:hypothetical protein